MRKCFLFIFVLLLVTVGQAQELLVQGGYGFSKTDSVQKSSYGFAQARLMFGQGLRIGPYVGFTKYGSNDLSKLPNPAQNGTEMSYGLSLDFYGPITYSYSTYAWVNTGFKTAKDRFNDGTYKSWQKTNGLFVSGGWFVTDEWGSWFGNNRIMFDFYSPTKAAITATYKGDTLTSANPYNKKALRVVLESGINRFGKGLVQVEPLIHFGYGNDFGRSKNYWELGGGIDLGIFKEWYRDIIKIKVFYKQDFNDKLVVTTTKPKGIVMTEISFNLNGLINAIKK